MLPFFVCINLIWSKTMQTVELKNMINLATLSIPLQQELIDFYPFLMEKQEKQIKNQVTVIDNSQHIMQLAGKISTFKNIDNPVAWQQQQRDEWNRL